MNRFKQVVLDNGLKVVLNKDETKHRTTAEIYINAGGLNTNYIVDNKKVNSVFGTAHFLEHYLLEHSIYGNITKIFDDLYIKSNGFTSNNCTCYYISTVHDFEENFIKLLNVVNNPIFKQEYVDNCKKPIISEINKKNDNKYFEFYNKRNSSIFKNPINNTLGSKDDILKVNVKDLEMFHNAFYQPNNEIIYITGNFNDDIIDLIKKTYDSFKKHCPKVENIFEKEDNNVLNEYVEYKKDINNSFFSLSYKIDFSKYSPLQMNKLDYYINFMLVSFFSEKSSFFEKLLQDKLTMFAINYSYNMIIDNYAMISIECYTNKYEKTIKLYKNKINNLDFDEDLFKKWKNKTIIHLINMFEDIFDQTNNFINNVLNYKLYQVDDIDFINTLNFEECKKMLNELDFSNYNITRNVGNDN